ncbi:MAG: ComEC/Rec2 family competence protein [Yoonia sp.]|nr:ComEC/Rec2 family competence protein [Yoonia sp.]
MIDDALLAQRGALIGWVPVCLGGGIGWYFAFADEPGPLVFAALAVAAVFVWALSRWSHVAYLPILMGVILVMAGIGLAKWRTENVAGPILSFRYYGPIEGRVVNIDRSASDAPRLTLDRVVLANMPPQNTPARVRVSVHGDQIMTSYRPGETLILTGHLSPPAGPAEPGGFDFQRHAWFLQVGAVGYTRTPVLRLTEPSQAGWAMRIFALRIAISTAVQRALPGESGAFAAAIMTGDRSAMAQGTLADLRAANLAHLLAISGLHMGLLTGFIFSAVRYGLAVVPGVALHWPVKKIAAICALVVGALYLALSGGNVATERAFVMVGVMFIAVLLDRRALTLRAVAIAAIIVLVWQPEALVGPGFQMSFSATTALVMAFGYLRRFKTYRLPQWMQAVLSVFLSSLIAGLATAPFAAAHFNQISHYGLIANLLSVPLMGAVVMPAAVLAACLAPFGLASVGLWVMDFGLRWILFVATQVASMDGALSHVHAPQAVVLPILSLGLLWGVLWQGRLRFGGVAAVALALLLWQQTARPDLLVAENGSLIGVAGPKGRALSRASGNSFVAEIWLENDGAPVPQDVAAARPGLHVNGRTVSASLGVWQIVQVAGKTALADIQGCGGADILISNQRDVGPLPCTVFDLARLGETGALAFFLTPQGNLQIISARRSAGNRPWNNQGTGKAAAHPTVLRQPRHTAALVAD